MSDINLNILKALRGRIEFPGVWLVQSVENCRWCLAVLQGWGIQEARELEYVLQRFEGQGVCEIAGEFKSKPITRVPTIAEYPPRDELLRLVRRVVHGLGVCGLSDDSDVRGLEPRLSAR